MQGAKYQHDPVPDSPQSREAFMPDTDGAELDGGTHGPSRAGAGARARATCILGNKDYPMPRKGSVNDP